MGIADSRACGFSLQREVPICTFCLSTLRPNFVYRVHRVIMRQQCAS